MKKKFTLCAILATSFGIATFTHAQTAAPENSGATYFHRCGNVEYEEYLRSKDPMYDIKKQEMQKITAKKVKEMEAARQGGNPEPLTQYTIPVVFHVVYNGTAQNLTDQQVQYAFTQLNQDWSRTNADAGNTPAAWQSIAVNTQVQFCLATKDPNGVASTGIIHKSTTVASFTTDDKVKSSASGGDDAWDPTKYLNIWLCNLGGGLLGYGAFPPITSTWGTVVHYITVGSLTHPNSAGGAYGQGRTLSHEIGHCFNLYHIWGDDAGACTGSDQISDTPNMADATSGCPSGVVTDACGVGSDGSPASSAAPGRMYQNYMDYTDDLCYNMFTAGQRTAVQSAISSYLMTVANNSAIVCTPAAALDAGVSTIVAPSGVVCSTTITPVVTLQNFGSTTLTSCKINYKIDALTNQVYNWTGSLATGITVSVTLPSMTTTAGTHTFTSSSSNPNAGTDANTANDQSTSSFSIVSAQATPVQQAFATATPFPPAGWTISNPDNATTWAYSATNFPTSAGGSMFMDNADYSASKQVDDFICNPINLASAPSPTLTFEVAYQLWTDPTSNPNFSDTLRVQVSTDCGTTWTTPYIKYGSTGANQLTTVVPAFATTTFVPTQASQWRLETVALPAAANVIVKFHHTTDYENDLYIDDINITATVGVNEVSIDNYVSVFPNPTNGMINVNLNALDLGAVNVKVYNLVGEVISETSDNISTAKKYAINLAGHSNGIYFVEVKTEKGKAVKKILLNK